MNGVEKEFSYSESLINQPKNGLTKRSLEIHLSALSVYQKPNNREAKIKFIELFPNEFGEFLAVFHSSKFDQLYKDSFIYISLFGKLADEFPELASVKLFELAKHSCFDADAPNHFRSIIRKFEKKHPKYYVSEYNKLTEPEKNRFELFLKASFHPHGNNSGFCK